MDTSKELIRYFIDKFVSDIGIPTVENDYEIVIKNLINFQVCMNCNCYQYGGDIDYIDLFKKCDSCNLIVCDECKSDCEAFCKKCNLITKAD